MKFIISIVILYFAVFYYVLTEAVFWIKDLG